MEVYVVSWAGGKNACVCNIPSCLFTVSFRPGEPRGGRCHDVRGCGFHHTHARTEEKMRSWEQQVEVFRAGEKILDRQRFQFPSNWVYVDNVEGEWGAFNEIVKRKESSVQTQIGTLQMQIVAEDKAVEQKTSELLQVWEKEKPVGKDPSNV